LYVNQLGKRIDAAADKEAPQPLTAELKEDALVRINAILDDHTLVKANVFDVALNSAEITAALTDSGTPERQQLQDKFLAALEDLFNDESVYMRERIYTFAGKIDFERIDDEEAEISDALKEEIRAMVQWVDETTTNPYERHPIINAASNVLDAAGMDDVAKPLLLAEIEHAKQPYYFMVGLADIEQSAGNYEAAIDWLKRAYDASTGPATRFQWGYYYVSGLIEMTPEDEETIRNATVNLVREVEASGGFYHRPKAQLKRLEGKLRDWGADEAMLATIRDDVLSICTQPDDSEAPDSACQQFLTPA
jgi:tetratricopeptide (TPR) repeat protein